MSSHTFSDTIAAIATAPGRGGVGIVRVSGDGCLKIAEHLLGFVPRPRHAHYTPFRDGSGGLLDQGICLFFPGPHSFTGEDVLELQGHGGPVLLDMLLKATINAGARLARPGEFSERAYLNDKIDLAQAEAIADLINASSQQAAKQALNSLQGEFSTAVNTLVDALIHLRMYVESAIDFPEEDIDFLTDGVVLAQLQTVMSQLDGVIVKAQQGALVRDGMKVVIAGRPNAGKSSLLNALAERDVAIVTDIAGTTRDVLREHIHIDGLPLHIIDTAGIRASKDQVEQIGIARAWAEVKDADCILLLIDSTDASQLQPQEQWPELWADPSLLNKLTLVFNKSDLVSLPASTAYPSLAISAKTGLGLDQLRAHLKQRMGYQNTSEGAFSARRRHIIALQQARAALGKGLQQLQDHAAGELLAEDLRQAQQALCEITGSFSSDDLLGRIFSSFCIGK